MQDDTSGAGWRLEKEQQEVSWGHASPFGERALLNMRAMMERLRPTGPILDIGGNDGYAARNMKMMGYLPDITIIEGSQAKVDYAIEHGVNAVCGNIEAMPFEDGQFEWGFCSHTLEHMEDLDAALSEIRRVCRNGCYVVVPVEDEAELKKNPAHKRRHTHAEWIEKFGECSILKRQDVELTCVVWSKEKLLEFPENYVVDFDDLCDEYDPYEQLCRLKLEFPNFRVTLFAIPGRCSKALIEKYKKLPWVELGIHGYHHSSYECGIWDYEEAKEKIQEALDMGFDPVFKCPGWITSRAVVDALGDMGVVAAQHFNHGTTWVGCKAPLYVYNDFMCNWITIHGHTWDVSDNGPSRWPRMFADIPVSASFHFVSEAADMTYDGIELVSDHESNDRFVMELVAANMPKWTRHVAPESAWWGSRHVFSRWNKINASSVRPGDVVYMPDENPGAKQLMAAIKLSEAGVKIWSPTQAAADAIGVDGVYVLEEDEVAGLFHGD